MRVVLAAAVALGALGQEKVFFEEKLPKKKLSEGWTWVREDPKAWRIADGAIEIRALPGTIKEKTNDARNLLLRKAPAAGTVDDPFAIEATVKNAPGQPGEQAGVILHQDDDTYVKLVRENKGGKTFVVMTREWKGEEQIWAERELGGEAHGLRLLHFGNKVQAEVKMGSPPEWTPAEYGEPPFTGPVKAGLVAYGAPAAAERWAKFTDVRIFQPKAQR